MSGELAIFDGGIRCPRLEHWMYQRAPRGPVLAPIWGMSWPRSSVDRAKSGSRLVPQISYQWGAV